MDWFLYDRNRRHKRVNPFALSFLQSDSTISKTGTNKIFHITLQCHKDVVRPCQKIFVSWNPNVNPLMSGGNKKVTRNFWELTGKK